MGNPILNPNPLGREQIKIGFKSNADLDLFTTVWLRSKMGDSGQSRLRFRLQLQANGLTPTPVQTTLYKKMLTPVPTPVVKKKLTAVPTPTPVSQNHPSLLIDSDFCSTVERVDQNWI